MKDPFDMPLKQYALMLGLALLGGLVSWIAKVRSGEAKPWNLMGLVGELATSAFAGLLAYYACLWLNVDPLLTPCVVGIAGHMGTRAIAWLESFAERYITKHWPQP